jgi:uncharacterized protein (TIGR02996 family)
MTEHEDFLRAILADPQSDTPLLIYADWLEEHGDLRGEFIRVQCEIASLPYGHERREQLQPREAELLSQMTWLEPLQALCSQVYCYRGFVGKVSLPVEDFLTHSDLLFTAEALHDLQLEEVRPSHIPALAELPVLGRFTSLDLTGSSDLPPQSVLTLLGSPHLAQLQELGLNRCGWGDPQIEEFAASSHLARLTALHLGFNAIGEAGGMALAASPYLRQLQWLDLYGNNDLFQHEPTAAIRALRLRFGDKVRL